MIKIKSLIKLIFNGISKNISIYYVEFRYYLKVRELLASKPRKRLSKAQKNEISIYFSSFGFKNVSTKWHEYVNTSSGEFSIKCIPEDLFYTRIEPALNRSDLLPALVDKNLLPNFFKDANQPRSIVKNQNGFYFDDKGSLISENQALMLCLKESEFVVKPSIDSGRGKNIVLHKNKPYLNENNQDQIAKIFNSYRCDFIIQERVVQHPLMERLNESSVNTVRVLSYLRHTEAVVLSTTLMIGGVNEFSDNSGDNSICCGIDHQGRLKHGYDSKGNQFTKTSQGFDFYKFEIPGYKDILRSAKECHEKMPYFRMVGWDFTIDDRNRVILLECNAKYIGINGHNVNNGYVFGKFTEEILEETGVK